MGTRRIDRVTTPLYDPRVGMTVGGEFPLLDRLGVGLAGPTYTAVQNPLDRRVIVELFEGPAYDDPLTRGRFVEETALLVLPLGPGLARYRRFGLQPPVDFLPGCLYAVRDPVPGTPLDAVLRHRASLPVPRALALIDAVLTALAHAHRRGVTHRAIRPAAVVLHLDLDHPAPPAITLLDTGLAPLVEPATGKLRVGDPCYFAPRTLIGEPPAPEDDLYATGALLYTLLTGAPPFIGPTAEVIRAHLERPIRSLPTGIDPDRHLTRVVRRAMGRDGTPFADAAAMAEALRDARDAALPSVAPRALLAPPGAIAG